MKTTHAKLKKIPTVPGLYRHENGNYYGKKKMRSGLKKVAALVGADGVNITDRRTAEKALSNWIAGLNMPAPQGSDLTVAELWEKFMAQKQGQAANTVLKCSWVKQTIDVDFPAIWKMGVKEVKPSHLAEFFAKRQKVHKAESFNSLTMHVKNLFAVAVADEIITDNPYDKVPRTIKRKKADKTPDKVPTIEECEKIVAHVRGQEFADTAERTADMLALMHLAALGQAELIPLDWEDVKWNEGKIIIWKRKKTGVYFEIPIYPHLKPFLVELWERQGKPKAGRLISILSPGIALTNACKRLGLARHSPRHFRKARIVWMLRKGVPVEYIAKVQGHRDNGVLIRRTYAWVITSLDAEYEQEQLAKMAN